MVFALFCYDCFCLGHFICQTMDSVDPRIFALRNFGAVIVLSASNFPRYEVFEQGTWCLHKQQPMHTNASLNRPLQFLFLYD